MQMGGVVNIDAQGAQFDEDGGAFDVSRVSLSAALTVTAATAAAHAVRMVVGSPTSPVAISRASGMGIPKAAAPGLPVAGWGQQAGKYRGMQGEF